MVWSSNFTVAAVGGNTYTIQRNRNTICAWQHMARLKQMRALLCSLHALQVNFLEIWLTINYEYASARGINRLSRCWWELLLLRFWSLTNGHGSPIHIHSIICGVRPIFYQSRGLRSNAFYPTAQARPVRNHLDVVFLTPIATINYFSVPTKLLALLKWDLTTGQALSGSKI